MRALFRAACATALILPLLLAPAGVRAQPAATDLPLMHLCEPREAAWDRGLPTPQIPPPPTDRGLLDRERLREAPLLDFRSDQALAEEAAKPDGWVTGSGTPEDPYVIRDLAIRGITEQWGLQVHFIKAPLIIENVLVEGAPPSVHAPAPAYGIAVIDSESVIVRHCQVSHCFGIYGGGSALRGMLIEDCYVYSTSHGIMTSGGSHCTARRNYVRDSTKYGVFLYNGTDHVTEDNYVAWTGREGTGTNGNAHRHKYLDNVILHSGWTAINVEGANDDTVVQGNLVVDTHYGIILGGNRTVCRDNQVFYGSQAGIWAFNSPEGLTIEENLVVGSGGTGIDVTGTCHQARVTGNRVWQSGTGIYLGGPGGMAEGNDVYRFYFGISAGGSPPIIRGNRIYSGRNAMVLTDITEPGTALEENTMHHMINGIGLTRVQGARIVGNRLESIGAPLRLTQCREVEVLDNEALQLAYTGFTLDNSTSCVVEGNRLLGGVTEALRISDGSGNTLRGNTVTDIQTQFGGAGLVLQRARGNLISGNTFERCGAAVAFQGAENRDNRLEGNAYTDNGQDLVMQEGAEEIAESNQVDATPEPRK